MIQADPRAADIPIDAVDANAHVEHVIHTIKKEDIWPNQ